MAYRTETFFLCVYILCMMSSMPDVLLTDYMLQ